MKKGVIVSMIDDFANGVKPRELKRFLEKEGYDVEILASASRSDARGIVNNILDSRNRKRYITIVITLALAKYMPSSRVKKLLRSHIATSQLHEYGQITHKRLLEKKPSLIICENNNDINFVVHKRVADKQILDLPCPAAEELYYGNIISKSAYGKLKHAEIIAYEKADALSFHWHTYSNFVKNTKYNGDNIISMGYGVTKKDKVARFSQQPRIVFLGLLNGYWVNTPLLEALCEAYPNIDVYGGPKPPAGSNINYKGYAPTLDVLASYQFGLITITDDELRKNSFSSKHLEYISYGLPVFTPSWRKDAKLDESSIHFTDVKDFGEKLELYSNNAKWMTKHRAALNTAANTTWDNAFSELERIIDGRQ